MNEVGDRDAQRIVQDAGSTRGVPNRRHCDGTGKFRAETAPSQILRVTGTEKPGRYLGWVKITLDASKRQPGRLCASAPELIE